MHKRKNLMEIGVNVTFRDFPTALAFDQVTDEIVQCKKSYKWKKFFHEDDSAFCFIVKTFEEYEAIATNAVIMGGAISCDISFACGLDKVTSRIEKIKKAARRKNTPPQRNKVDDTYYHNSTVGWVA